VKGTIRGRRNKHGTQSYVCQVFAGPCNRQAPLQDRGGEKHATGHQLIHKLVAKVDGKTATPTSGIALTPEHSPPSRRF
jgi:hypothetical protein